MEVRRLGAAQMLAAWVSATFLLHASVAAGARAEEKCAALRVVLAEKGLQELMDLSRCPPDDDLGAENEMNKPGISDLLQNADVVGQVYALANLDDKLLAAGNTTVNTHTPASSWDDHADHIYHTQGRACKDETISDVSLKGIGKHCVPNSAIQTGVDAKSLIVTPSLRHTGYGLRLVSEASSAYTINGQYAGVEARLQMYKGFPAGKHYVINDGPLKGTKLDKLDIDPAQQKAFIEWNIPFLNIKVSLDAPITPSELVISWGNKSSSNTAPFCREGRSAVMVVWMAVDRMQIPPVDAHNVKLGDYTHGHLLLKPVCRTSPCRWPVLANFQVSKYIKVKEWKCEARQGEAEGAGFDIDSLLEGGMVRLQVLNTLGTFGWNPFTRNALRHSLSKADYRNGTDISRMCSELMSQCELAMHYKLWVTDSAGSMKQDPEHVEDCKGRSWDVVAVKKRCSCMLWLRLHCS